MHLSSDSSSDFFTIKIFKMKTTKNLFSMLLIALGASIFYSCEEETVRVDRIENPASDPEDDEVPVDPPKGS